MAATADGVELTFQTPPGSGPFPGVVVLQEVFGVNDDLRNIAARLTAAGYAVALPDLYTPGAKPLCIARTVIDSVRGGGQTTERVGGVLAWLAARPEVDGDRIGVIGFCLGGGFAITAAAAHPFRAAATNYGRVPESDALRGLCPIIGSYGGEDRQLLPHARRLERIAGELGVPNDVKVYPGAGHSFMNRSLPAWLTDRLPVGYEPDAASDAWRRILSFFGEHLGQDAAKGERR